MHGWLRPIANCLRSAAPTIGIGLCLTALQLLAADDGAAEPLRSPLTPADALRALETEPGLQVELVAAEPLVVSPVALAFDERGRMFVAENRDYPTGPLAGQPPQGRIALLEDRDGDGQFETRHEFATGLTFPNGVLPYAGGVLVTCAPDILFLKDTDGDHHADQRRVLFTGFSTAGSTQLRVSHPTLGIDGWIYVTSGLLGGEIVSPPAPDQPAVSLKRTDFRFRFDASSGEAADGGAQFGQTFDDFGRRFICYNRVQVQHVVLSSRELSRNPLLRFSETVHNCPAETESEPLPGHGAAARIYPISQNVTTADSHAGTFTAACGVTVFRGDNLPELYRGGVFSCDPTANLVHFDRLEPLGATFAARRLPGETEALRSRDDWFRPVFLANGPDGALYVCDMYRKTIEHPDYLPAEIRKQTDFESGKQMGRIWRVRTTTSAGAATSRQPAPTIDRSQPKALVEQLRSSNGWQRDTAQRLLLEENDSSLQPLLTELIAGTKAPPASVVCALHLLAAKSELPDDVLRNCLQHASPRVREAALHLGGQRFPKVAASLDALCRLSDDPDARVRFQLALALGEFAPQSAADEQRIAESLAAIALQDGKDRWTRVAVFSSLRGREALFFTAVLQSPRVAEGPPDMLRELGRLLAASQPREALPSVARQALDQTALTFAAKASLLIGLLREGEAKLADDAALNALLSQAGTLAADGQQPTTVREAAIQLLGCDKFDRSGKTLLELIGAHEADAIQSAAIQALGQLRDVRGVAPLLQSESFAAFSPTARQEVLNVALADKQSTAQLLDALEAERIATTAIDAGQRQRLTQHPDAALRERSEKLFGAVRGDRAQVYEEYKAVADWPGDSANGRVVFRRTCATCHRLDREGFAVGPDLFGIRNQAKAAILLHILAPDHEITSGFAAYQALTGDGRTFAGLIVAESPTTITLRMPQGKEERLLRSEIDTLAASKQSLMPQGLEKTFTKQELADLLAHLKGESPAATTTEPTP